MRKTGKSKKIELVLDEKEAAKIEKVLFHHIESLRALGAHEEADRILDIRTKLLQGFRVF